MLGKGYLKIFVRTFKSLTSKTANLIGSLSIVFQVKVATITFGDQNQPDISFAIASQLDLINGL